MTNGPPGTRGPNSIHQVIAPNVRRLPFDRAWREKEEPPRDTVNGAPLSRDDGGMVSDVIGPVTPGSAVVHVAGFVALMLVTFTGQWAGSLVTIVHEGGHVAMGVLSGRPVTGFKVHENHADGGATEVLGGWGVSRLFVGVIGYMTAPLLGLAGANLVLDGKAWSVLWASVFLLVFALLHARDFFTNLLVVGYGVLIGWVAVSGSPDLQATVAVLLVWWMLMGEFPGLVVLGVGGKGRGDPAYLSHNTWIPGFVWVALWWFVAIVCLWVGGRRLLGF
ncbi:MAG: M50 family metallopeptidase [Pseudonocardiales bacterium]|nr:M50 family metallopeptidase [Pseudonocardiales bacterium]